MNAGLLYLPSFYAHVYVYFYLIPMRFYHSFINGIILILIYLKKKPYCITQTTNLTSKDFDEIRNEQKKIPVKLINYRISRKVFEKIYKLQIEEMSQKIEDILNGIPRPLTGNEIMQLGAKCSSQGYPLQKIIQIGRTLFKTSSDSCLKFLEFVEKHELNRNIYKDFIHQQWKIQIYYSLAALALTKGTKESDKQSMQKWQKQFNKYLNLGSNVKTSTEKVYQLLHGFNSYYSGDFARAAGNFNQLEQLDKKQTTLSTIALLGLAQTNFMHRKYDVALQFYKRALIANKNLPTKARLGMAYCFYQLEKYQLAEKCFQRILNLDPKCLEAYLGIAVISYRNKNVENYFINLREAFKLDPNDPLVILHLSQHYLISGQYQKCQKLSEKGLVLIESMPKFMKKQRQFRDDYAILKARFNNLLGQTYHAVSDYEQARKYYELAKDKTLRFNDVLFAQTVGQAGKYQDAQVILQKIFNTVKPAEVKIFSQFFRTLGYFKIKHEQKDQKPTNASHYYKQALKFNKYDYNSLIEYSTYLSDKNDKKQLLKQLQTAVKSLELQGKQPRLELINNIAVTLLEDHDDKDKQKKEAEANFRTALKMLSEYPRASPEEEIRYNCLYMTVYFNWALFLQWKLKKQEAIQIHDSLIKLNKYYVDSYLQIVDILHGLGEKQRAYQYLSNAISQCSKLRPQQVRIDRLYVLKAYLHHLDGNYQESKDTMRRLGSSSAHYDILLNISMTFETLMKKQAEKVQFKDFFKNHMLQILRICQGDHYNVCAYIQLTLMTAAQNKLTFNQGNKYFSQLKVAERQFPAILYNYGIFSLLYSDYQNACFCFARYKQKTRTNKADEYLALAQLLKGDVHESLNTLKKAIMCEPQNLKYRFQYAYVNEKRVQKLYEEEKNFKQMKQSSKFLTVCKKIYESLSKLSTNDYLRTLEHAQMKQRTKNEVVKLRITSEDRDRYVKSQILYYTGKEKQIIEKQRRILQQEAKRILELKKAKESRDIAEFLVEDEDQQQDRRKKERLKKLHEMTEQANNEANKLHQQISKQQKLKAEQGQQLRRKRKNPEGKKNKKPKKVKSESEQEEQDNYSDKQDKNQDEYQSESKSEQEQRRRKKKHKKASGQRSGEQQDKKKKKMKKKQRKQRSQREDQSDIKNQQQNNSEKQSNPFDQNDQASKSQEEQRQLRARQEPQKKNKKKDKKDDEEIDLKEFQINM